MRTAVRSAAAVLTLALVPGAGAVGPSLPAVTGPPGVASAVSDVSYVATASASGTRLSERAHGRAVRSAILSGTWGIPLVTLDGSYGGLSPNGRLLVLGDDVHPDGSLRARSRFAVVDARTLALVRTISLAGDYSFDALSPQGRTLYLIHHLRSDATRYQVKGYDLRSGRLLPGVIADKRQEGWLMSGYPVARAATAGGRWVYTLYQQADNYPFVHALDTVNGSAICIGLPWKWATPGAGISGATLALSGAKLDITGANGSKAHFVLDTRTFRVSTA
jgi:hypothetical protein